MDPVTTRMATLPATIASSSLDTSAVLSFCYAPCASHQYDLCRKEDEHTLMLSELQDTCQKIKTTTQCNIIISSNDKLSPATKHALVDTPTDYNLTLTGPLHSLATTRSELLLHCPIKIDLVLPVPSSECPTQDQCDAIAKDTNTTIQITPPEPHQSCFASDHTSSLTITGVPEDAEKCRVRLLVQLDENAGLHSDIVRIPLKYQYLIGGRKRTGLHPIIEETCTNIYFPSPFTAATIQGEDEDDSAVYITGDATNVTRVKDMLNKLISQKAKSMYHKSIKITAQKLDWMLLHRKDEIRKIMHDNGSFVGFPPLGLGDDSISVYAENRVNAERTLRAINFVACSIYEAIFYFNDHDGALFNGGASHPFFDSTSNLSSMVSQLSQVSGAQVVYKMEPGCIEVMGTERAIRNVYQRLQEMAFLKPFHQGTIFRVESANEQRDFISGKKNGKINKIMKTTGAKIRFMPLDSDYNFVIEVDSTSFTKVLDGLTLLQEELPAEISFFVPETYHKRIIGVGGKNIQRIMKKYGVYVKFSNTEEFASLGGYYDNEDNVVARTPMKNQINLDNLRHAVMELILPKDRDYVTRTVTIPFRVQRQLAHDQSAFFTDDIGKKTNTRVLWPDCELASDDVVLVGPDAQIELAMGMVESVVPRDYELRAPRTDALTTLLESDDFKHAVVIRLQHEFAINIGSYPDRYCSDDILLVLHNSRVDTFSSALNVLTSYLKSQNVAFYEQKLPTSLPPTRSAMASKYARPSSSSTRFPDVPLADRFFADPSKPTMPMMNPNASMMGGSHSATSMAYPLMPFGSYPPSSAETIPSGTTVTPVSGTTASGPLGSSWKVPGQPVSENNLRAIFDAPMDLTEQEKVILANYRYQRMGMSLAGSAFGGFGGGNSNNGSPTTTPPHTRGMSSSTASSSDIWSTPTTANQGSPQSQQQRSFVETPPNRRPLNDNVFGAATGEPGMTSFLNPSFTMMSDSSRYPPSRGFNPYGDDNTPKQSLKSSKSMPEPLLESHFQQQQQQQQHTAATHQPLPSFHHTTSGFPGNFGYSLASSSPHHQSPPSATGFFGSSKNEEYGMHSLLENISLSDGKKNVSDVQRQHPQNHSASRPPPGMDLH